MRTLALMLVLVVPLALRSADWYSVRLLAKPVVQPVTFAVAAEEGSVPVLVRTGEGVARAFATNAVPDGSFPLGSLVGIRRLDVDASVRHVPERAFENAADLRVVSFEGRVRRIDGRAFAGSTNLAAVVLHEATSVLVASNAFAECSRSLSCVYPFAPVMTAQDGAAQSGAPVFPRVRFLTGEALRRELSAGVDTSRPTRSRPPDGAAPSSPGYAASCTQPLAASIQRTSVSIIKDGGFWHVYRLRMV